MKRSLVDSHQIYSIPILHQVIKTIFVPSLGDGEFMWIRMLPVVGRKCMHVCTHRWGLSVFQIMQFYKWVAVTLLARQVYLHIFEYHKNRRAWESEELDQVIKESEVEGEVPSTRGRICDLVVMCDSLWIFLCCFDIGLASWCAGNVSLKIHYYFSGC